MKTDPNDPAFPLQIKDVSTGEGFLTGLTKREYIATLAMQGIISSRKASVNDFLKEKEFRLKIVTASILYADALIKLIEKTNREL